MFSNPAVRSIDISVSVRVEVFTFQSWMIETVPVRSKCRVFLITASLAQVEERIDVLPNDIASIGYFEEPATCPFADERVAVWQSVGAANKAAEK